MPEFIPQPQLPTGLVEQTNEMRSRAGDPWARLAISLGQDVNQGIQNYKERQANAPLTPDQIASIKQGLPPVAAGTVPGGQGPTQIPLSQAFPKGVPRDIGVSVSEQQAKLKESENLFRAKEAGYSEREKSKEKSEFEKTHTVLSPEMAKALDLPEGTYPNSFVTAKISAAAKVESAKTGAESREKVAKTRAESITESAKTRALTQEEVKELDSSFKTQKEKADYITKHPWLSKVMGVPKGVGSSVSGTKSAPEIGTIVKGHKYIGGDPSKPESWEAQ